MNNSLYNSVEHICEPVEVEVSTSLSKAYSTQCRYCGKDMNTNETLNLCFIVKFNNGNEPFFLANWEGDPGRTLLKLNAKKFRNHKTAKKALKKAIKDYPNRNLIGIVIEHNAR